MVRASYPAIEGLPPLCNAFEQEAVRIARAFHPGGHVECVLDDCGWAFDVPRPEIDRDGYTWIGLSRPQVQEVLRDHYQAHVLRGDILP